MRQLLKIAFLGATLAIGAVMAHADGIGPGVAAPAIEVKTWYKGTPVKEFSKDKIYVVEFWATWCGPCRESIPHISELAKKNKDVTFVGVSIWEDDNGTNVKKFVTDMGDKMDYNVGYSGNKTGMSQSWMTAAGQNGIPTAFIVKNKTIQWIGHPMEMEKPLEEVKAGKFDIAKFKTEFDKQAEQNKAAMAASKELSSVQALIKDKKYAEAKAKLDEIEPKYPQLKSQFANTRFTLLGKTDAAAWEVKAKELAAAKDQNSLATLSMFALDAVQAKDDLTLAAKAIEWAVAAAKDDDVLTNYYGASYYDMTSEPKKALPLIEKAIAAIPKSEYKDNKGAKEALEKMREDIAKKAKS